MTRSKPARLILLLALGLIANAGCTATRAGELTPVTLQLRWTHQGYFGGYYVADKYGFYADEGLSVRFLEGGRESDATAPVLDGRAQFGVAEAPALLVARGTGKPVRALATIFRRSPTVYISKPDSGIANPAEFKGKTIRVTTPDMANFLALMRHTGLSPGDYRVVNLPSDVSLFFSDAADVWTTYVNNFVVTLEQAGHNPNIIYPDDYGIHFYGDSLYTTDDIVSKNPDLVLRFLRASLRGWAVAVKDPGLVGNLVRSYDPEADPALETLKMQATQTLVNTNEDNIGWMRKERWAEMARTLEEQGLVPASMAVDDAFATMFLQKIYGDDPEAYRWQ